MFAERQGIYCSIYTVVVHMLIISTSHEIMFRGMYAIHRLSHVPLVPYVYLLCRWASLGLQASSFHCHQMSGYKAAAGIGEMKNPMGHKLIELS
jgi:hypothetical protein